MSFFAKVQRNIKVLLALLLSKLIIFVLSFKRISELLNRKSNGDYYSFEEKDIQKIRSYAKAIYKLANLLPGEYNCFSKSLTAVFLLRQSYPVIIYFGVKTQNGEIKAHAWVKINDIFVAGEEGHKEYQVIKSFK